MALSRSQYFVSFLRLENVQLKIVVYVERNLRLKFCFRQWLAAILDFVKNMNIHISDPSNNIISGNEL